MLDINDNSLICVALKEYGQVGPKLFQKLLMIYGDPANIFGLAADDLSSMVGIDQEQSNKIIGAQDYLEDARQMINQMQDFGISVISYFDSGYPGSFRGIAEPPLMVLVKGDHELLGEGGVAIVGTTSADHAGMRMAVDFAKRFVRHGKTIISGLAAGIDTAAHLGCLRDDGRTIAVLGCGHLNIYPEDNTALANLISETGAVISEYDIYAEAIPGRLISRNRLIAALADIVLVAQIGEDRRGELYTAEAAIDQGKPVFILDQENSLDDETLLKNAVIKVKGIDQIDEMLEYIIR